MPYKIIALLNTIIFAAQIGIGQQLISFKFDDNAVLYADLYLNSPENPYIILFHAENGSRGEFSELAPALNNLEYNCLAVDISNGDRFQYVKNKTVFENNNRLYESSQLQREIDAAINYAYNKSNKQVLILASGINASHAAIVSKSNHKVKGLVMLNPFDAMPDGTFLHQKITPFDKPTLIVIPKRNDAYYKNLMQAIPSNIKSIYYLQFTSGKNFYEIFARKEEKKSLWIEVLIFFKNMKNNVPYLNQN